MRLGDALYGSVMNAHHYFRDPIYRDSSMIPWLLVAGRPCHGGQPLSTLVNASDVGVLMQRWEQFPCG